MRLMVLFAFITVAVSTAVSPSAKALDVTSELTLKMDGFRRMNGDEIRMLLSDRTVHMTYGREDGETVYFYGADGVRSSMQSGFRLDRQWTVSQDRLCEEYLRPLDYACAKVFMKDDIVQLCPEAENICWYVFSGFTPGDVEELRQLAPLPSG